MTITIDQADAIREAWYRMDGPADRPKTIAGCHTMIENLLELLGDITGVNGSSVVSQGEETMKDWFEREVQFAIDAHELIDSLQHEIEGVLHGASFGNEPGEEQYRRAGQLIACRRMTCGGPNLGHEHIS